MKHASERELWVAVILQATEDGLKLKPARKWFLPTNTDFVEVCNLAGLDPDDVAERAADAFRRSDQAKASGRKFEIARPQAPAPAPRQVIRYEHDGKALTIAEWSRLTGISAKTIQYRLDRGYAFAEAINLAFKRKPPNRRTFNGRPGRRPKLHVVNGVAKTMTEWCQAYDVSYQLIARRLKRGMTLEHALKHIKGRTRQSLLHPVEGIGSKTYGEWADYLGIGYDAFLKRLRDGSGRTVAQAVAMGGPRRRTASAGREVVAILQDGQGTGGGSVAQERAQIEFSANPEKVVP